MRRALGCILALLVMLALLAGCARQASAPAITGEKLPACTLTQEEIQAAGKLVLVNEENLWPQDVVPEGMVSLFDTRPKGLVGLHDAQMLADEEAFAALIQMLEAAREAGHEDYLIVASYRSYEKQQELYGETDQGKNAWGKKTVQAPGASEHHTGLAFDMGVMVDGDNKIFKDTPQGAWVAEHLTEYGFVIRYPDDKIDITGIDYEPWHIRYVGKENAKAMEKDNLCLEEYVKRLEEK